MNCVQCGSIDIVENVDVFDQAHGGVVHSLTLGVYKRPKAMLFKGRRVAKAFCNVCVDCGFVMLKVTKFDAARIKGMKRAESKR